MARGFGTLFYQSQIIDDLHMSTSESHDLDNNFTLIQILIQVICMCAYYE